MTRTTAAEFALIGFPDGTPIHKRGANGNGACLESGKIATVGRWKDVTCKRCLKLKPKTAAI